MEEVLLEVKGITKRFKGLVAIDDASFDIREGEILSLIGPNGAGKTTLFNVISGIYKPNSGTVIFEGEDITGKKLHEICRMGVGRTFQLVKIYSGLTVLENVMLGGLYGTKNRRKRASSRQTACELIKMVGLSEKKGNLLPIDLTLIDRKRVELARALATEPTLLLLDELMTGLNPTEIRKTLQLLGRIRDNGVTVFLVEHIMKAVMAISDRIIVLHHGKLIADGPPEQIAHDEQVVNAYLGEEYA